MKLPELQHRMGVVSEKIAHYENEMKRVGRGHEIAEPEVCFYVDGVEYTIDGTRINFGTPKLEINLTKKKTMNAELEHAINTFIACLGTAIHPENRQFSESYLRIREFEIREFPDDKIASIRVAFSTKKYSTMYWNVRLNFEAKLIGVPVFYDSNGRITFDEMQAANEILCTTISISELEQIENEPN